MADLLSLPLYAGASRFLYPSPALPRVRRNLQFIISPPDSYFCNLPYPSSFINKYICDLNRTT